MNLSEHLLVVLGEECAEVQKEISKALRFGIHDCAPKTDVTNAEKISIEFIEAMAARDMLVDLGVISIPENAKEIYEDKKSRIAHFVGYAKQVGTIK